MALDFSPTEFVHVHRNSNLNWIWRSGDDEYQWGEYEGEFEYEGDIWSEYEGEGEYEGYPEGESEDDSFIRFLPPDTTFCTECVCHGRFIQLSTFLIRGCP